LVPAGRALLTGAPWLALRAHDSCFEPKSKHDPTVHADRPSSSATVVIGDVESALARDDDSGRWQVPRSVLAPVWAMMASALDLALGRCWR
jgi:hypothetical protein